MGQMSFCTQTDPVTVYRGYGNVIEFPITSRYTQENPDLTNATNAKVCIGGVDAEYVDDPSYVSWDEGDSWGWSVLFSAGMFTGLQLGEQDVSIVVYTPDHTDGLVLTSTFKVNVIDIC